MHRIGFLLLFSLLFVVMSANADFVTYQLTGEIPIGADLNHPFVTGGETWTANFIVDTFTASIGDIFGDSAGYQDAVVSGSLFFSGGYIPEVDFSGYDVVVFNDTAAGFDAIAFGFDLANGSLDGSLFQALTTNDQFLSLDLPDVGSSLTPAPSLTEDAFFQLSFTDDFGTVTYNSGLANNVSFEAIPEPSSLLILSSALLGISLRRRKTD